MALPSVKITGIETGKIYQEIVFGQGFKKGELLPSECLKVAGGPTSFYLTQSQKSLWQDGSVKFSILSGKLPVSYGVESTVQIQKGQCPPQFPFITIGKALEDTSLNPIVKLTIGTDTYVASLRDGISKYGNTNWITGDISDFLSKADFVNQATGAIHPLLVARFETRASTNGSFLRVGAIVESSWAYEPYYDVKYNVSILNGETELFKKDNLTHLNHSRWVKYFQLKGIENKTLKHDFRYLSSAGLLPAFNPLLKMPATVPTATYAKLTTADYEVLGPGPIVPGMGTTGALPYIGPLPSYQSMLVISNDQKLKDYTIEAGRLAGTFQSKYRDKATDEALSIEDYPFASKAAPAYNKVMARPEYLVLCKTGYTCSIDKRVKDSHQPQLTYLPYILSGDHYFLEELVFWLADNLTAQNAEYRGYEKGTMSRAQVRGQGWFLRDLGFTLNVTPESHPLKPFLNRVLKNNLDKYLAMRDASDGSGSLGYINSYLAGGYVISPWMDDFFTFAAGELVASGHDDWKQVLEWKARFTNARMLDPNFCFVFASEYHVPAAPGDLIGSEPSKRTGDFFKTWAEIYNYLSTQRYNTSGAWNLHTIECGSAQMAKVLTDKRYKEKGVYMAYKEKEMVGYDGGATGYPANMQVALATATQIEGDTITAWNKFVNRPLIVWSWGTQNQYSVIPRTIFPSDWFSPLPSSLLIGAPLTTSTTTSTTTTTASSTAPVAK